MIVCRAMAGLLLIAMTIDARSQEPLAFVCQDEGSQLTANITVYSSPNYVTVRRSDGGSTEMLNGRDGIHDPGKQFVIINDSYIRFGTGSTDYRLDRASGRLTSNVLKPMRCKTR